jgi:NADH dehydrogenase
MIREGGLDLATGAFSYTGAEIAGRLLVAGRGVRTFTFHPDRAHALRGEIEAFPYQFPDPGALARSLDGVSTLYNTYWVRFDHAATTFTDAVENSRTLFAAARRAGVERIVHLSITNPSLDSPLPYFRGKARVERALAQVGVPFSIVRPTWIFGGPNEMANNIAWILRHMPLLAIPGSGDYPVQPIHVQDVAEICIRAGHAAGDEILDAAGPETMRFEELVMLVRSAVGARGPVLHVPSLIMMLAARALGMLVRDVVLTADEISGLRAGLLVSHQRPLGAIRFSEWLHQNATRIGLTYANEMQRHYIRMAA